MANKVTIEITEDGYTVVVNLGGVLYRRKMIRTQYGAKMDADQVEGFKPLGYLEDQVDVPYCVVDAIDNIESEAYEVMCALYQIDE